VGATRTTRRYDSPLRAKRAAETRAALLEAGHRLFLEKGWLATGMREVAAEAGVATETLYSYFSSKRGLFQAIVDVALVGDDRPVAVADRPEFTAMGEGPRADRIAAAARLLTTVHARTAPFAKVIREAATADEEIAAILRDTRERQREDVGSALALITGRRPTAAEGDGLWAIASPELYFLLVDESHWTPEQYEAWMAQTLDRMIP
jgi:AcrR family transcriptional regulator